MSLLEPAHGVHRRTGISRFLTSLYTSLREHMVYGRHEMSTDTHIIIGGNKINLPTTQKCALSQSVHSTMSYHVHTCDFQLKSSCYKLLLLTPYSECLRRYSPARLDSTRLNYDPLAWLRTTTQPPHVQRNATEVTSTMDLVISPAPTFTSRTKTMRVNKDTKQC